MGWGSWLRMANPFTGFGLLDPNSAVGEVIYGTGQAEKAIQDAKNAQSQAYQNSLTASQRMLDEALRAQRPYRNFGLLALPYFQSALLGGTPQKTYDVNPITGQATLGSNSVSWTPQPMGYSSRQDYIRTGRQLGARNLLGSGYGAQTLANVRGSDLQNQFARLGNMIDLGQPASNLSSTMYGNNANQIGQINTWNANAQAPLLAAQGRMATSYSPFNIGMDAISLLPGLKGLLG